MDFTGLSQPLAGAQGRQARGGGARMFCFASRFLTHTAFSRPIKGQATYLLRGECIHNEFRGSSAPPTRGLR